MSEAEVSLRLAAYLANSGLATETIAVAIDGAQVRVGVTQYFDVTAFLGNIGWVQRHPSPKWQGTYISTRGRREIEVHSKSGTGDVSTRLPSGNTFLAEAKKGPLGRSRNSAEYPLLREALGQLLTIDAVTDGAVLAVAVPAGERFLELAARWREAPLVRKAGILILTVSPSGEVGGWPVTQLQAEAAFGS